MSIKAYIPLTSQIIDKDRVHYSWHTFMHALHKLSGGTSGQISMNGDTIQGLSVLNLAAESIQLQDTTIDFSGSGESILLSNSATSANFPGVNPTGVRTGTIKPTYTDTAQSGWILIDDGSIGNADSGATTRANSDTKDLFIMLWNEISNTYAPVSGGRGSSALEDFNANKTLTLPPICGRLFAGSGQGTGLTSRTKGDTAGEEVHTITEDEMAEHTHYIPGTGSFGLGLGFSSPTLNFYGCANEVALTLTPNSTELAASSVSQTDRQNMQQTTFIPFQIKL